MCGIAGVIQFAAGPILPRTAERLDAALAHRGPDGRGVFHAPADRLLLVHRRLAIIDPGDGGRQPMSSPDGRYRIVFNGEIYNHRELRRTLERRGEHFVSQSDTEVLLRLVMRDGLASLRDVRGMFAFGLWDSESRTLSVARDRFGIKPLYIAATPTHAAFASEVRALLAAGLSDRTPDPAGILAFLRWGHVPSPLTWVQGITALAPGAWTTWHDDGAVEHGCFANVADAWCADGRATLDDADMVASARAALADSVAAHLVADVPVGIFLSGGVDSAALTALARPSVADLHTYTVVVDEKQFSEAPQAALVAKHFATTHHTLRVDAASIAHEVSATVAVMDQPTVDGFNTYAVSRAVAQTGVKAVLSGVGGDELFGGYPSFRRLPRVARLASAFPAALPFAARLASHASPRWQRPRWHHLAAHGGTLSEAYRALRGLWMPAELPSFFGEALRDPAVQQHVRSVEQLALRQQEVEQVVATTARLESTVYLRSQLLRDVDVFSMAHGLEVRVPFVDAPLLSTVWPSVGRRPDLLRRKALLTRAVPELPPQVVGSPKRGFTLPFELWIDGALRDVVHTGIDALVKDRWISASAARELPRQWSARQIHWSRMWGLGMLGHFLSHHRAA